MNFGTILKFILANRIRLTFFQLGNLLECRRGNNSDDRLVLRFPTPETQYPYHEMDRSAENKCVSNCPQHYCLQDICLTRVMADTHFPSSRPVSVPVSDEDRNITIKARSVINSNALDN